MLVSLNFFQYVNEFESLEANYDSGQSILMLIRDGLRVFWEETITETVLNVIRIKQSRGHGNQDLDHDDSDVER